MSVCYYHYKSSTALFKFLEQCARPVNLLQRQTMVTAKQECVGHDFVSHDKSLSAKEVTICWMSRDISRKAHTGLDVVLLKIF